MPLDPPAEESLTIARGPSRARILTYGATLADFRLDGFAHSLVLGSEDAAAYRGPMRYFGAIVGPIANRIAGGRAPLDGRIVTLATNEGDTALHGGPQGLSQRSWSIESRDRHRVVLGIASDPGDGGPPGPLTIRVTYEIEEDGALRLEITGQSPARTFCNPAFHGYWCLGGEGLAGHRLRVAADHYLPTDRALIPTGEIAPVAGTAYDLRSPTPLPAAVDLDTNFCLNGTGFRKVAWLETDRLAMTVETDAPGLQIYDAAGLDTRPARGHHGKPYGAFAGLAMEPQLWPDAPNHPEFPSIELSPDRVFRQSSRFRFIRKETP